MQFTVYILHSSSIDKYYVGFTALSIEERLRRHNTNHKGFTGTVGDWQVKYTEKYAEKSQAVNREKEIKSKKLRAYIEKLIAQLG